MKPAVQGARSSRKPKLTELRRPTINDVAALSGVSKSTVSNVLRGRGSVAAATQADVMRAVQTLGYRPNAAARNLVLQRTHLLGVVVGDLGNAFHAELVKRIEHGASARGYTTLVCNTGGHVERESSRIEALLEQRVDGIALLDFSGDQGVLALLLGSHVPVLMVSCWADGANCVATDDDLGLYLAVEHLAGLGHVRIAHAVDPIMEASTRTARAHAFAHAMRDHRLTPRAGWIVALDESEHDDAALEPVLAAASPPTAFVADSDYRAIRLIELLEGRGLAVPDDISIVGFDGIAIGALSRLGLTTVAQPMDELAAQAVELLVDRVERGDGGPPVQRRLRPALVARRSTARSRRP